MSDTAALWANLDRNLFARAIQTFGSPGAAVAWFDRPSADLAGEAPRAVAQKPGGRAQISVALARLEVEYT